MASGKEGTDGATVAARLRPNDLAKLLGEDNRADDRLPAPLATPDFPKQRSDQNERSRQQDGPPSSPVRYPDGTLVQKFLGNDGADTVPLELRQLLKHMCDPNQHARPTIDEVCSGLRAVASS
jgi:hypothetical protein